MNATNATGPQDAVATATSVTAAMMVHTRTENTLTPSPEAVSSPNRIAASLLEFSHISGSTTRQATASGTTRGQPALFSDPVSQRVATWRSHADACARV